MLLVLANNLVNGKQHRPIHIASKLKLHDIRSENLAFVISKRKTPAPTGFHDRSRKRQLCRQ